LVPAPVRALDLETVCRSAGKLSCRVNESPRLLRPGALAYGRQCSQNASMPVQITIRDVPEKVRDELAARAALQGKSMQEYLRAELERMASRPSVQAWLEQVRKRKRAAQTRVPSGQILKARDADRR